MGLAQLGLGLDHWTGSLDWITGDARTSARTHTHPHALSCSKAKRESERTPEPPQCQSTQCSARPVPVQCQSSASPVPVPCLAFPSSEGQSSSALFCPVLPASCKLQVATTARNDASVRLPSVSLYYSTVLLCGLSLFPSPPRASSTGPLFLHCRRRDVDVLPDPSYRPVIVFSSLYSTHAAVVRVGPTKTQLNKHNQRHEVRDNHPHRYHPHRLRQQPLSAGPMLPNLPSSLLCLAAPSPSPPPPPPPRRPPSTHTHKPLLSLLSLALLALLAVELSLVGLLAYSHTRTHPTRSHHLLSFPSHLRFARRSPLAVCLQGLASSHRPRL